MENSSKFAIEALNTNVLMWRLFTSSSMENSATHAIEALKTNVY